MSGVRRLHPGLLAALVLYALLRGALLHLAFDQTAMPNYELYPMGTVPSLIRLGSDIPLHLHYDNAAGQIVTGVLAVPFYAAFGESYLSLKLVPALLGSLLVVAAYALLASAFSRRAATLGALLLAVGPAPLLFKYSLMASGNHFENLFFTTLAMACAYRALLAERRRGAWLVLGGFTCGLAVFVFLGALLPVGLLVLVHLAVRGWRGTLLDARWVAPALLVGAAPLLLVNLGTGGRGADFLGAKFGDSSHLDLARVAERAREFLTTDLFRAPGFEGFLGIPDAVFTGALLAAGALAWLLALPRALSALGDLAGALVRGRRERAQELFVLERAKLLPFVLLLPLTALAFGLSNFVNGGSEAPVTVGGYRYFLPTFLFASLLVAILSARLLDAGGTRRHLGWTMYGAAFLAGSANLVYLTPSPGAVGIGALYRGPNFTQLARQLVTPKNELSVEQQVRYADGLPPLARHQTYTGIGFCRAGFQLRRARRAGSGPAPRLDLDGLLAGLPRETWVDVARGAGSYLGFEAAFRPGTDPFLRESLAALLAPPVHPYARLVLEGVAQPSDYPPTSLRVPFVLARAHEQLRGAPPEAREALARGFGLTLGRLLRRGIEADTLVVGEHLGALADDARRSVAFGLGWGLADERDPPAIPSAARARIAPEALPGVLRGYGAGLRHVYGAPRAREWIAATLPEPERVQALRGLEGLAE